MARLPRLYAPDTPQLVQARLARPLASPHAATPVAALDFIREQLAMELRGRPVSLHGWAILLDRIILLATPAQADALPRVVQGLGRGLAARVIHGRSFHERYRNTLLEDGWINACLVWLETLPMQDGLVDAAACWPWSSAQEHVGLRIDRGLLTHHPTYWNLGNTPFARQARYRDLLHTPLAQDTTARIRAAIQGQWALGNEAFIQRISSRGSRRATPAARGRPRKCAIEVAVTK